MFRLQCAVCKTIHCCFYFTELHHETRLQVKLIGLDEAHCLMNTNNEQKYAAF